MTKEEMLRLLTAATPAPAAQPRAPLPETCSVPAPTGWHSFGVWRSTDWNGGPLCPPLWGSGSPPCAPTGVRPQGGGDGRRTARPDADGAGRNPRLRQRRPLRRVVRTGGGHPPGEGAAFGKRKRHRGHRGGGPGGESPGEAAIREAQAVVDRERPVGADARSSPPLRRR